ncbi:hypothetical protein [Thioalkalivibrio sp.]|uniref:hypothetical protein n=1 Tax=Thioalkalivibrio sp. TaxID=2093813 RepID=UPI00356A0763
MTDDAPQLRLCAAPGCKKALPPHSRRHRQTCSRRCRQRLAYRRQRWRAELERLDRKLTADREMIRRRAIPDLDEARVLLTKRILQARRRGRPTQRLRSSLEYLNQLFDALQRIE